MAATPGLLHFGGPKLTGPGWHLQSDVADANSGVLCSGSPQPAAALGTYRPPQPQAQQQPRAPHGMGLALPGRPGPGESALTAIPALKQCCRLARAAVASSPYSLRLSPVAARGMQLPRSSPDKHAYSVPRTGEGACGASIMLDDVVSYRIDLCCYVLYSRTLTS